MAGYDYDRDYPRRYTREDHRERDREPRYVDPREYSSKTYSRELVPRAREDSELSVEEIRRDFPPPSGRDIRRARSPEGGYYEDYEYSRGHGPRRDREYERRTRHGPGGSVHHEEEERKRKKAISKQEKIIAAVASAALLAGGKELYDRHTAKEEHTRVQRNALSTAALAGAGALAAYQGIEFYNKQQQKKDLKATYILHRGRDGQIAEYYSDEDEGPKERKGHKNFLESALAATGLGAAVKSLTGGGDDKSDRSRSRRGSDSSSRSRSRGGGNKVQKAAMASLLAGATEAFRVAKEPGSWKGEKAKRVLTAAAGAATVDAVHGSEHGKMGLAESVIGGLVGTHLINGSRKNIEEDSVTGRSRSRSRARSTGGGGVGPGIAALATAGLGALAGKKVLDHSRSRSRGRSADSGASSPNRRRSRSRSVVDKARNGLAKLGLGSGAAAADDYHEDRSSRRSRHQSDDYDDGYDYGRSRDRDNYYDDDRQYGRKDVARRGGGRSNYESESDLGDSDEDEKRAKKMKGKQILTGGLAAVATIHAAHQVYQSMEKRKTRQKAVREGRLSPEEAKKLKTKALMQDAASVGIAALGIKSAVTEMKEVREMTNECHEFMEEKERRHLKREQRRKQLSSTGSRSTSADRSALQKRRSSSYDYDDGYESAEDYGPRYRNGNPYDSTHMPAPPIGSRSR